MKRRGTKAGIVIETLIILAALGLLGKAFITASTTYKFVHLAEPSEGIVNAVDDAGLGISVQFFPQPSKIVAFTQSGLFFGYNVGQHVPILYDPNDPELAIVNGFRALWSKPLVMAIPGLFLLFFGLRLRSERSL